MVDHIIIWIFARAFVSVLFLFFAARDNPIDRILPTLSRPDCHADPTEVMTWLAAICLPLILIAGYCSYRLLVAMDEKESRSRALRIEAAQKSKQASTAAASQVDASPPKEVVDAPITEPLRTSSKKVFAFPKIVDRTIDLPS
jgi:hypothetical protein